MKPNNVSHTLDTKGKCCPAPMIEINKSIKKIDCGDILEVIATDPATQKDVPSWCERTGNTLLHSIFDNREYVYHYYIKRRSSI